MAGCTGFAPVVKTGSTVQRRRLLAQHPQKNQDAALFPDLNRIEECATPHRIDYQSIMLPYLMLQLRVFGGEGRVRSDRRLITVSNFQDWCNYSVSATSPLKFGQRCGARTRGLLIPNQALNQPSSSLNFTICYVNYLFQLAFLIPML